MRSSKRWSCLALLTGVAALVLTPLSFAPPVPKGKENTLTRVDTEDAQPATDYAKAENNGRLWRQAARQRATSVNNLKQLALAFHSYHDAMNFFPMDVVDKNGKALLSWRVLLLPYLEEDALYKQFRRDEPWDSKHNLKLVEKMPKVFASPRVTLKRKGYTVYQVFSGKDAPFGNGKKMRFANIPDGLSNTIYAVEATAAVPWTKPADVPFDAKKDLPAFGKAFGDRPLAVMMDGSVRTLDLKKIGKQTLKHAIMPADGMVLGQDWDE